MKRYLRFLMLPSVALLFLLTVSLAQAAATLISFQAEPVVADHKITLSWQTVAELGLTGFRILQGDDSSGSVYNYVDLHVEMGVFYYYKLVMIYLENSSTFSDVIPAFQGNTPTPTPTITSTPTNTPQPTFTITRTRTPSPFHVVTFTTRPRSTYTPTETPTITPTPTVSPTVTTTLAPLPSLTLLFPVRTSTPTPTPVPTYTSSPVPPTPTATPKPDNHIPLRLNFLGGIIILLWITLAGFLFAYLRRMSR